MTQENIEDDSSELQELLDKIDRLPREERELLRERLAGDPRPPLAGWTPDPLKFKVAVRHLREAPCQREELAAHLSAVDGIREISSMNFGLVDRESNDVFAVERGADRASDVLSLTPQGEELAAMFDDDTEGLRPAEKTLYRGLSLYGHMAVFLGILERFRREEGSPDGMLKADLIDALADVYDAEAETYASYLGTLCDRLDLIERSRDGNQARYRLDVPERW